MEPEPYEGCFWQGKRLRRLSVQVNGAYHHRVLFGLLKEEFAANDQAAS
jgi:hypothetical protein